MKTPTVQGRPRRQGPLCAVGAGMGEGERAGLEKGEGGKEGSWREGREGSGRGHGQWGGTEG